MKVPALLLATFSCLSLESNGFSFQNHHQPAHSALKVQVQDSDHEAISHGPPRLFGVIALASVLSFSAMPAPSFAADPAAVFDTSPSSSILLSEQIKSMDMSLPSYGDISDAKASSVDSLFVDPVDEARAGRGEKNTDKVDKKKEAAAAKAKARENFEKEMYDNIGGKAVDVVDMSIPSYDQSTSQSQRSGFSL